MDEAVKSPFWITIFTCIILYIVIVESRKWLWNNRQPVVTAEARVAYKHIVKSRGDSSDSYFVAFDVGAHGRHEFDVGGREYNRLFEGNTGTLTFQGTRYKGFVRPGTQVPAPGRWG